MILAASAVIEGPRAAKIEELPQIIKLTSWIFGFEKRGVYLDKVFPHVFCRENIENLRVIVSDGKVISHLGIWEGWLHFYGIWLKLGLIGCVCTHPDYRMKGYASALVKDAITKLSNDHVDIVMVSGARTLYTRAGCIEAGIIYDYRLSQNAIKDLVIHLGELKVEPYTEDRLLDLIDLHQREPIRFRRTFEEFKLLANRAILAEVEEALSIFVSYKMGRPTSYVALVKGVWDILTVVEYAGSRIDILKTLYKVSKTFKVENIRLSVPYGDWELIILLEESGLKPQTSHATASLAILNPILFVEKIRPYIEDRLGTKADFKITTYNGSFQVNAFDKHVTFDCPKAFTLFVFGKPESVHVSDTVEFNFTRIPEVFRKVFPIPSFNYGLNFI